MTPQEINQLFEAEAACKQQVKALQEERDNHKGNPSKYDPLDKAVNLAAWEQQQVERQLDNLYHRGEIDRR